MAKASAALSHCSSPATPGLRAQRVSTGGPLGLSLAFGMLSALEGASSSLHDPHHTLTDITGLQCNAVKL